MYNKIIGCLKSLGFSFKELDEVIFYDKMYSLKNAIEVPEKTMYIELNIDGTILIVNKQGGYIHTIRKNSDYKMIFDLGYLMGTIR